MGPYRGVARPGACFAIERLVDEVARELGREPFDLRRQNIVTAAELPYRTAAGMRLDTGDYVASLDTARDMIDLAAIRARQAKREPDGRAIGVGFAFYTEQSGHGTTEWVKRKSRVVPGYESANARMLPDGSVIIHVGTQNHGQGHETTLAQIAAHELTIDPALISIRYGDTATSPFGFGTFASRSIVFAGGAVARSCRMLAEKIQKIGAHLLQTDVAETPLEGGAVHGPRRQASASPRSPTPPTSARSICRPAWSRCSTRPGPTSRRKPAACSPMAPMPWWSRSIPTPASSKSSTTRCRRTAAP